MDVEKGGDAPPKDDAAGRARFALSIVELVLFLGSLACGVLGVMFVSSSNYTPPPIPVAHLLANAIAIPGASLTITSVASLSATLGSYKGCTPKNGGAVARSSFSLAWGIGLVAFAVLRFWAYHPYTLPECPCPTRFHVKINESCVQCPGYEEETCNDDLCVCGETGVCSETTAQCSCGANWQVGPNGTCSECSERATNGPRGECSRCTRRFKPDAETGECSLCRNGYAGTDCLVCHPNFQPRLDENGTIALDEDGAMYCSPLRGCKDDQPADGGRYGPMCEAVPENKRCAVHGDVNAVVKKPNNKLVLPNTFTTTGQQCEYDFQCASYNCMGFCTIGKNGPRAGALCRSDSDCLGNGRCESMTCAAEYNIGEDECQCSRSGFLGPRCEKCKGYNGVHSASVCGGRGTCAAKYVDGQGKGYLTDYVGLECLCSKPAGVLDEFPKWSGPKCALAIDQNGQKRFCAEGFFGDHCDVTCPSENDASSWGGIGACDTRGTCNYDETTNTAVCHCDEDSRVNGAGFFAGPSCSKCWDNFYGINCQSCPQLAPTSDCDSVADEFLLTVNPDTCFASCPSGKTCDDGKSGSGICLTDGA